MRVPQAGLDRHRCSAAAALPELPESCRKTSLDGVKYRRGLGGLPCSALLLCQRKFFLEFLGHRTEIVFTFWIVRIWAEQGRAGGADLFPVTLREVLEGIL